MGTKIKFGTDGWRAVIAEDFTFDNVRICAQATADYLKRSGLAGRGLIVGYDTRFASEDFAAAAAEVVAANGIKVYLCTSATPTPVISYGTFSRGAGGAVIITASHNAANWNGFKIKSEIGASAPPEVTAEVERNIERISSMGSVKGMPLAEAERQHAVEFVDLAEPYLEQVSRLVDLKALRRAQIKVIVDPMHGAGAGYVGELMRGGLAKVMEINGERNPIFPGMKNPEPIAHNLRLLSASVRRRHADAGLATDGDADRFGAVAENGVFLTTLQMYALLALYLLEVRRERGAIVKTITTTAMLDRLGEIYGVPVRETPVGFKWIAPIMINEKALIGGEESGGYGFRGHVTERDGILASMYFLDFMVKTGKTPSQLLAYLYDKVGPHHFDRLDVTFPEAERAGIVARVREAAPRDILGVEVKRLDTFDGFRFVLADGSWLLIRFSGTEPLLRIYAETGTPRRVQEMLQAGRTLAGV